MKKNFIISSLKNITTRFWVLSITHLFLTISWLSLYGKVTYLQPSGFFHKSTNNEYLLIRITDAINDFLITMLGSFGICVIIMFITVELVLEILQLISTNSTEIKDNQQHQTITRKVKIISCILILLGLCGLVYFFNKGHLWYGGWIGWGLSLIHI
jgi:hypothetical protein